MNKLAWILLLVSQFSVAAPELKGEPEQLKAFLYPDETTISISESAEETAYSDRATVNLIVTTEEDVLSDSMKSNSAVRTKIRQYLNKKGIENSSINNSKFASSPQFGLFSKKPSSYKIVNRIAIVIVDESHLQDIAEVADQYDEVTLSGVTSEHSKKEAFNIAVKEAALAKVMKKKSFYEKSLGMTLQPVKFYESEMDVRATEGSAILEEVIVTGIRASKSGFSSGSNSYTPPRKSSFDEVKYHAKITVEFKVINAQ